MQVVVIKPEILCRELFAAHLRKNSAINFHHAFYVENYQQLCVRADLRTEFGRLFMV
jgi:hypothetical protein